MERVTIERSRWLRGTGRGMLLNAEGRMCCLGFVCQHFGITERDMLGQRVPAMLRSPMRLSLPQWLLEGHPNSDVKDAMLTNDLEDSISWKNANRESDITRIFARHDIEVTFVD